MRSDADLVLCSGAYVASVRSISFFADVRLKFAQSLDWSGQPRGQRGLRYAFTQRATRRELAHAVLAGAMKLQANVCCPLLSVPASSHGLIVNLRWIVGYATYLPWTVMF